VQTGPVRCSDDPSDAVIDDHAAAAWQADVTFTASRAGLLCLFLSAQGNHVPHFLIGPLATQGFGIPFSSGVVE
jgi:hypothetical protein